MKERVMKAWAVLLLSSAVALEGQASEPVRQNSEHWNKLEKAYQESRSSHDLSAVKSELQRLFGDELEMQRRLGLNWIGQHLADLTYQEQEELNNLYIALHPQDAISASLRNTNASNRLAVAPREERATLYWAAVRQGFARIPNGETLDRVSAIRIAAVEGLEEFLPCVERYATELNDRHHHEGFSDSDFMRLLFRLRAGAANRTDALRLHAERLAELGDAEFAGLISTDLAFRQGTFSVASQACGERQSELACRKVGEIYQRQSAYQRDSSGRRSVAAPGQGPRESSELPWMSQLKVWAGHTAEKGGLEKQDRARETPE